MGLEATDVSPRAALDAALERAAASVGLRVSLDAALAGVEASLWPSIAWRTSRLTADGFPVELSFTNADPAPRFTAEVAGPEVEAGQRLRIALAILTSSDPSYTDHENADRLHGMQAGAALRWGAWLGGREERGSYTWKLYVEVPRAGSPIADDWACRLLGPSPLAEPGRGISLRMIGWDPAADRLELYLRPGTLNEPAIACLLAYADQVQRLSELLDLLHDAWQCPLEPELPGAGLGCSISLPRGGDGQRVVSVIAFARSLFGPDARARNSILRLAERRGWNLQSYAAASEPLSRRVSPVSWHGMVSFTVAPQRDLVFGVGIRPPCS